MKRVSKLGQMYQEALFGKLTVARRVRLQKLGRAKRIRNANSFEIIVLLRGIRL